MIYEKTLFKRIGFYQALELLRRQPLSLKKFHQKLHSIHSYYNAFRRVKERLIERGLIDIYTDENDKILIRLTKRGLECKQMLMAISEMI